MPGYFRLALFEDKKNLSRIYGILIERLTFYQSYAYINYIEDQL